MSFLLIINSLECGGAERVLASLANEFSSHRDQKITIVSLDSEESFFPVSPDVQIVSVTGSRFLKGPLKLLAIPYQSFFVSRIIKKTKPDFVLSFLHRANIVNFLDAHFLSRGRAVFVSERSVLSKSYSGFKMLLFKKLLKWAYGHADKIIAISRVVKEELLALGVNDDKIVIIPNPVNVTTHKVYSQNFHVGLPLKIITTGRLVPSKRFEQILFAIAAINKSFMCTLDIAGNGPMHDYLSDLAATLQIQDKVNFLGYVSNVTEILHHYDLFVSASEYESFGNSCLEASAAGLPVVVPSGTGGIEDIYHFSGQGAVFYPGGDVSALVNAIVDMYENNRFHVYGVQGHEHSRKFDIKQIADNYMQAVSE
ncbi:hypothetical protein GEOBRER4_n2621 [Citrifermentans bremense]|uniref:Glycosyltransferase n=1 Tax=Citrifermentans bremense TaxID=60035 RepID=A0A6S6M8M8_9BACT|nr:glycosyltransferase [Citrifermentans bremense]BCG47775.1 hypothetical protein GEOBRER4_n2621 [Citrifermentans bremense]